MAIVQVIIAVAIVVTSEVSFWWGRRQSAKIPEPERAPLDAMQAATLALLGLLLAFTAAMAEERFVERRNLIVDEANAIGTAYLRRELLGDARAAELTPLFREYVQARVDVYDAGDDLGLDRAAEAHAEELQRRMWAIAMDASQEDPHAVAYATFVQALNLVIDLEGSRYAAFRAQLPPTLFVLLVAVALVSIATVGLSCGLVGRRNHIAITVVPLLVGFSIAVVLDLDSPRVGLIRVGQPSMLHLADFLERDAR